MAISVVQTLSKTHGSNVASAQSAAFGSSPVSGNTIIVVLWGFRNGSCTITVGDNAGNTYTRDKATGSAGDPGTGQVTQIWRCTNITGGANFKITVSFPSTTGYVVFGAIEVSGLDSSPLDGGGTIDNAISNAPDTGSFSTTNANDLIVIVESDSGGGIRVITEPTSPGTWTQIVQETDANNYDAGDACYQIVSSIQTNINPTWALDISPHWYGAVRSYKATSNPVPTLSNISPTSGTVGDTNTTITLTGTNFVASSVAQWGGVALSTSFIDTGTLTAVIPTANLTSAGTFSVTVFNTTPGGGTSGAQTFTVNNPVPGLTNISPSSASSGSGNTGLTVTGSNFQPSSVVQWNGVTISTVYVSANSMTATIPASNLSSAGTAQVTVVTGSPGGGTSAGKTFTITGASFFPVVGLGPVQDNSGQAGGYLAPVKVIDSTAFPKKTTRRG